MDDGASHPLDSASRSVECYQRLGFIDEGTYGLVFRARDRETGVIYALKQVKFNADRDGFPTTALREISTLFSVSHENVVALREVVVDSSLSSVYLVLEYAPHDLFSLLECMPRPYSASETKSLMRQLLAGLAHLHGRWIVHRDLKPSNLLLTGGGILKICDFGLARLLGAPPPHPLTPGVTTLWYRAPEVLLAAPAYAAPVDVWAAGCIFAELVAGAPLLPGRGELDQLARMAELLGAPCEARWRGFDNLPNAKRLSFRRSPRASQLAGRLRAGAAAGRSGRGGGDGGAGGGAGGGASDAVTDEMVALISRMLEYDPARRISAADALEHAYFSERPAAKDPALIQTFPATRR